MSHYRITNQLTGEVIETATLGNDLTAFTDSQLVAAELACFLNDEELGQDLRAEFTRRGFTGYETSTTRG